MGVTSKFLNLIFNSKAEITNLSNSIFQHGLFTSLMNNQGVDCGIIGHFHKNIQFLGIKYKLLLKIALKKLVDPDVG